MESTTRTIFSLAVVILLLELDLDEIIARHVPRPNLSVSIDLRLVEPFAHEKSRRVAKEKQKYLRTKLEKMHEKFSLHTK